MLDVFVWLFSEFQWMPVSAVLVAGLYPFRSTWRYLMRTFSNRGSTQSRAEQGRMSFDLIWKLYPFFWMLHFVNGVHLNRYIIHRNDNRCTPLHPPTFLHLSLWRHREFGISSKSWTVVSKTRFSAYLLPPPLQKLRTLKSRLLDDYSNGSRREITYSSNFFLKHSKPAVFVCGVAHPVVTRSSS